MTRSGSSRPEIPRSAPNSRLRPTAAWSSSRATINATAPWLLAAGGYPGHGLQAPLESSKISPAASLLHLGVDFKDLQSRHFRFHSLGSFLKNTSHELRRLPSASFTDEPHPVLLPFTTKERIRAAYLTALWGVSTSCAEAPLIPGFTPAARRTSHLVLRSCFRPGTRLGLSRKPNLQQPAILSVTSCLQNLENSGMSSRRFALPQPCHFRFSKSFKR